MNSKILQLIFLLSLNFSFAQRSFSVEYEADYELVYKPTKDSYKKTTTFALLINESSSYFKDLKKYIADSLSISNKKTSVPEFQRYVTDFRENIGVTSSKIYINKEIAYTNYYYEEPNNISWKVENEFKTVAGYKSQKAETIKYGRKWTAWFTADIPFQFGPYKFSKLPGLITEIYDSQNDYHYTLYAFRKRKYLNKSANVFTNVKKTTKKKVEYAIRNQGVEKMRINEQMLENKADIEMIRQNVMNDEKNKNPIELKPFE